MQINQDRSSGKNGEPAVFFLHLPKTGGTTLSSIMDRYYQPSSIINIGKQREQLGESGTHIDDFRLFIIEQQRRVQLVRGHYEYGLHENMRLPYTYMTLLRDPIDRAVSWYYFIKEDPECPNYKNYVAKSEGFADFTRKGFGGENSMTETLLSGEQKKTASNDWERLEMARENLRRDFSVIGFLEKFDEAIVLFKRESGWN